MVKALNSYRKELRKRGSNNSNTMEPYRDEEDGSNHQGSFTDEPQEAYRDEEEEREEIFVDEDENVVRARQMKMKPMSVETELQMGQNEKAGKMAFFAAFLSVSFLIAGYFISQSHEFHPSSSHMKNVLPNNDTTVVPPAESASIPAAPEKPQQQPAQTPATPTDANSHSSGGQHDNPSSNSDSNHNTNNDDPCSGQDADYFQELYEKVKKNGLPANCAGRDDVQACACHLPIPDSGGGNRFYEGAMKKNIAEWNHTYFQEGLQPDVVIYGDVYAEFLAGRQTGNTAFPNIAEVTEELLTKRGGGKINGLVMGIAGDSTSNLNHRLHNGLLPKQLKPKVVWLNVGSSNIERGCNTDAIVVGIMRNIEIIRELIDGDDTHESTTPVVINSIPPIAPPGGIEAEIGSHLPNILREKFKRKIRCYVKATEGVYFADVTNILTEVTAEGTFLKKGFYTSKIIPSPEGVREWEEMMVSKVLQIIS